jgi:hypothetical protein
MTALDRLKFVGFYVMGCVVVLGTSYVFGRSHADGSIPSIVVFLAAGTAGHGGVPVYPLPRRSTLTMMGALMALGGLAVAVGEATVGWDLGWGNALAFAGLAALFYPLLFNWAARRKARAAALAAGAST